MLPAAIVMVSIMVIITSSLLSNSGFLSNSQYSAAAKIKSDSLASASLLLEIAVHNSLYQIGIY